MWEWALLLIAKKTEKNSNCSALPSRHLANVVFPQHPCGLCQLLWATLCLSTRRNHSHGITANFQAAISTYTNKWPSVHLLIRQFMPNERLDPGVWSSLIGLTRGTTLADWSESEATILPDLSCSGDVEKLVASWLSSSVSWGRKIGSVWSA